MIKLRYLVCLLVMVSSIVGAKPFEVIGQRDNMYEIEMPGDGHCMFWAVAAGNDLAQGKVLGHHLKSKVLKLRELVADEYKMGTFDDELAVVLASDENEFDNKEDYIKAISDNYFGGDPEILAMSKILEKNVVVHMDGGNTVVYPYRAIYSNTINVYYTGNHYNLLSDRNIIDSEV